MLTYHELVTKLSAWEIVAPGLSEQQVFNIQITTEGEVKVSLEESVVRIPIT